MADPRIYSVNEQVRNVYSPDNIPAESFNSYLSQKHVKESSEKVSSEHPMDEFIRHIRHERKRLGKKDHPHETIKEHMLKHTRKMGMDDATGSGFWNSVWHGIKSIGSKIGDTVTGVVSNIASNPLQAISTIAPLLV